MAGGSAVFLRLVGPLALGGVGQAGLVGGFGVRVFLARTSDGFFRGGGRFCVGDFRAVGFQFGKIDGVLGRVSAIHEAHERGEVAVDGGHGRGEEASHVFVLEPGGSDGMPDVEGHLSVGEIEVEAAEGQAAVRAGHQLEDLFADFGLAGEDRQGEVDLQDVVIVGDAETAGVDGRIPAHGEEDDFLLLIGVEVQPVAFEVTDERVEGSGEVGHGEVMSDLWRMTSWWLVRGGAVLPLGYLADSVQVWLRPVSQTRLSI